MIESIIDILKILFSALWPYVGIFILGSITWRMWVHYIQNDFISGIDTVVLEVIPPREVERSPAAMELFFTNALYHWSLKGGMEEYWQGAVWLWFSLEIVSIEGQVHFYIHTPSRVRELIETQLYAQFPQAQIKLVDDYTLAVDEISENSKWAGWGCEFTTLKHHAYPIRTYKDYGLDDDPKEEYKIDPLSPIIEFFSTLKKGEQAWIQLVVTPSKQSWDGRDWVEESKQYITKLLEPYTGSRALADNPNKFAKEVRPPKFLEDTVKGMAEKTTKLGFDAGIRVMYITKKESFNIHNRRNMRLLFRQFANPDRNQLWRINATQADAYGGIFTISKKKVMLLTDRMLGEYRDRSFFHSKMRQQLFNNLPWPISPTIFPNYIENQLMVLNTEELATLWHFPGQIMKVPSLERIESKEAAPPSGLPT